MHHPMDLTGKTILITGASQGIGEATAILVSKLGARVILVARNEENLKNVLSKLDGEGHGLYSFDLNEIDKIEVLIKEIVSKYGKLDGLVYSAGISRMRPLKMTNQKFLDEVMHINFNAFVEITRCATSRGNYNDGLSVVAMSSVGSIKGYKSKTAYSASKAAIDAAIRCMAKELGSKSIRLNSIVAGSVRTDIYEEYKQRANKEDDDISQDGYCLGLPEPIDIANSIAFLLSEASRMITGTSIVVDSGATS